MDEDLLVLERDYCPLLEDSLVRVVWEDFKAYPNALEQARGVLGDLHSAALIEQATGFDPSGSSGEAVQTASSAGTGSPDGDTSSNVDEWVSQTTDDTLESACFKDSEHLDSHTKEAILAETFPTLRPEFVARVLQKCSDNLSKATDELLNHVYLADADGHQTEALVIPKGIDAFAEEHHLPQRSKRGKGKKKKKKQDRLARSDEQHAVASTPNVTATSGNYWQKTERQVTFIVSRTELSSSTVSSIYHRNGASVSATILELIKDNICANANDKELDAGMVEGAIDLTADFPHLDLDHAVALVRLTAPSLAYAKDLAKALTEPPETSTRPRGDIEVIPRYAPLHLSEPSPEITHSSSTAPSLPPSALPHTSASLATARSEAFAQASAAYRKGKSSPYMKAAAGFYAQIGRDLNANLKAMTEAEADALVASQSSPMVLDLHGVSVQSATRISKARTQAWWDGLGEARIPGGGRSGVGDGFRIITGLGRHSEGGKGKIGPAVVRALVREGWKIEVGTGELVILGKARR